jgi:hypothetical protein
MDMVDLASVIENAVSWGDVFVAFVAVWVVIMFFHLIIMILGG